MERVPNGNGKDLPDNMINDHAFTRLEFEGWMICCFAEQEIPGRFVCQELMD